MNSPVMLTSARPASPCASLPASPPPAAASGEFLALGSLTPNSELILLYLAFGVLKEVCCECRILRLLQCVILGDRESCERVWHSKFSVHGDERKSNINARNATLLILLLWEGLK